jgi:hypothetical protein
MRTKDTSLSANLKRLGFAQDNQMSLYGQEFELLSDPIVIGDDLVFVDAVEKKSGRLHRVRIPLTIVNRAKAERHAA